MVRELLRNALEAVGRDGSVRLLIALSTDENQQHWAELEVTDDGPGLSEREREHLFDPFFSGREAGRGLGFGLSKAWRIVDAHGGTLELN